MLFNRIILFGFAIGLISCAEMSDYFGEPVSVEIISMDTVLVSKLDKNPDLGLVLYKNEPFSGVSVAYYKNGQLAETITYKDGKKHRLKEKWFPFGIKSYSAEYENGKLHGITQSWWSSGIKRSQVYFKNGKVNGIQHQWYKSGALFKELNYVDGKESGMQRAWRENGEIYTNYEAKNGRFFGLRRSTLCYGLEDEVIQN